jgi:hypothetical protein
MARRRVRNRLTEKLKQQEVPAVEDMAISGPTL